MNIAVDPKRSVLLLAFLFACLSPGITYVSGALGMELLGRSMMIFETAGITILTAMIAATAVAIPVQNLASKNDKESSE